MQATITNIYWTSGLNKIMRSNLDGSGTVELIGGMEHQPGLMAVDGTAGKMYWTESWWDEQVFNTIRRANLDGTGIETVFSESGATAGLSGIGLDVTADRMYWATAGGTIHRANLDGTGAETILTLSSGFSYQLAIDSAADKVYWANDYDNAIQRANLDGTSIEDLITDVSVIAIGLDIAGGKMYFNDSLYSISLANLDGTGKQKIIDGIYCAGPLALDTASGKIYFDSSSIYSANFDGTAITKVLDAGTYNINYMTLGPIPEPASILLLSFGMLLIRKRRTANRGAERR